MLVFCSQNPPGSCNIALVSLLSRHPPAGALISTLLCRPSVGTHSPTSPLKQRGHQGAAPVPLHLLSKIQTKSQHSRDAHNPSHNHNHENCSCSGTVCCSQSDGRHLQQLSSDLGVSQCFQSCRASCKRHHVRLHFEPLIADFKDL